MNNEDEKNKIEKKITPIDGFDGFEDRVEDTGDDDDKPAPSGVIKGNLLKFSNEAIWKLRDGEEVSPDLELVAVDILRIVQKWLDKKPVETRTLEPGEKIPDIKALNDACPKSEWGEYNGKPQGPWQFQYVTYLVDLVTMDRYTFPTGTTGGAICTRDLADKVRLMRRFRGQHVFAVLTLADTFMPTNFGGRQRPHFIIKRWVQIGGGDTPALPAPHPTPPPIEAATEPLPGMKTVEEPTLSEKMGGDEVPFDDSLDPNVPVNKPVAAVPAPKPATRSQMTKKGVQKLAGGRDR
jgi:hypothetical protein